MRNGKVKNMDGQIKKRIIYAAVTVILMLTASLLWTVTVQSRSRSAQMLFDNSMYEEKERAYREQVSDILQSYDCFYSGVMLTRTVDWDGGRQYCLQIHDDRFSLLCAEEKKALLCELEQAGIQDSDSEPFLIDIVLWE